MTQYLPRARGFVTGLNPSPVSGRTINIYDPTPPPGPGGSWDTRKMRTTPLDIAAASFSTWAGPTGPYRIVGAGDGTGAPTYATLALAIAASVAGDTILLRSGRHWVTSASIPASVALASYPDEIAWLCFGIQEAYDDPASFWEPGVGDEYVSVDTFTGIGSLSGWFANSMVPIQATNSYQMAAASELAPLGLKPPDEWAPDLHLTSDPNLSIGTDPTKIRHGAFSYVIDGVTHNIAAADIAFTATTHDIPDPDANARAVKFALSYNAAETPTITMGTIVLSAPQRPVIPDGHVRLGNITVRHNGTAMFDATTTALNAAHITDTYDDDMPWTPYYFGPCVRRDPDTSKIHIRLSHTHLNFLTTSDRWNLGGDYNYTGETDPRLIPLYIDYKVSGANLLLNNSVTVRDLVVVGGGGDESIRFDGKTGVTLDNVWLYPGNNGVSATSSPDTTIQNCKLRGLAAPWSSRGNMKQHGTPTYNVILNGCPGAVVTRNEITDGHDLMRFDGPPAGDYEFSRNLVENGNDDGLYMPGKETTGVRRIFLNIMRGTVSTFPTTGGGGGVTEGAGVGTYIYRNLIDRRIGAFGGPPTNALTEMDLYYARQTVPDVDGAMFMSHSSNYERSSVHFYHNTVLSYSASGGAYYRGLGNALRLSVTDCYNNILVLMVGNVNETLENPGVGIPYTFNRGYNIAWSLEAPTSGSITTEIYADPKFVHLTTDRFDPDEDLGLEIDSPAIDGGLTLSAIWPDVAVLKAYGPDCGAIPYGATGVVFGPASEY